MFDQRWSQPRPAQPRSTQPHPSYNSAPLTPFTLCEITGDFSVCIGCCNKYSKNHKDMCIQHQEWREYTLPGQAVSHVITMFNVQCVWLRCPWFDPTQLEIPPEVMTSLGMEHKSKLAEDFGIIID